MNPPPVPATCPKCHASLPPGAPLGLCPACLMDAAGTDSDPGLSADPFAAPLDLDTLRRAFPQLEILAPLGAGGMGRVYKVRQPNLDRIVALKVLPPEFARDPAWVERFTREARALARLNHPHIVQVYDVGQTNAAPGIPALCWLIMEYVDGVTLRQVQRTGGLSAREALALVPKLCDALQYAHEKNVLHRDIKPENILLDVAGSVKIADFGLAKLGGSNPSPTLTMTGARLGTAAYMAPEQIESPQDVDHRADIYSLGVVLYELLTGGLPLGRFPAPSEKSGTDPRLDHIVFRTLEKERDRRYQAAGDVRTALADLAAQGPPAPIQPKPREFKPVSPAAPTVVSPHEGPPPLPAGAVRKAVGFTDRNRSFPSSGTEAAGYGCGWMLSMPLRFALCFAPIFIPILWLEAYKEFGLPNPHENFLSSMGWVTAITGLASWLCVRPMLNITKWPDWERVKRKAPLLFLVAILLWGATLVHVAVASRSWPSRGVAGSLSLTCSRPPVSDKTMDSSDAELDAMFLRIVEKEFAGEMEAVLGTTGLPKPVDYYHYGSWSGSEQNNPLRKTWTLAVAATSRAVLNTRLMRVAEELTAALPESVRGSINVNSRTDIISQSFWRLDLFRDENLFLLAAIMTLGGWFAGMTRGRPLVYGTAPVLLAAAAVVLHWPSASLYVSRGSIVPAGDRQPSVSGQGKAMELLAAQAQTDPAAAALHSWIAACRRLDRAAVEALSERGMDTGTWEKIAGVWLKSEPLVIVKELRATSRGDEDGFYCLLVQRSDDRDDHILYRRSNYYGGNQQQGDSIKLRIIVRKEGEKWLIQQ